MPARPNVIGARCETQADCGSDLQCWSESAAGFFSLQGGIAGGYCTATCVTDVTCQALEPFAGCIAFTEQGPGFCFAGCISEYPADGEQKCLGRSDVACWSYATLFGTPEDPLVRERGLCLPQCGSDEECGGGRVCDGSFRLARCRDQRTAQGAAIGEPCTTFDDCAGRFCRELPGGGGACSASCTLGSESSCGFGVNASVREAACVLPYEWAQGSSFGPGDVGSCAELCDTSADCAQAGFECEPTSGVQGRAGACIFRGVASVDAGAADSGD
jgi:hypothetical protein